MVEFDLTRRGDWQKLLRPHRCPARRVTAYRATVRTPADPDSVYLYPIPLRSPIPPIDIPLRHREPPVRLDVQPLIDRCYVGGRYGTSIDYKVGPLSPLDPDDAAWADELLRAAGRR